MKVKDNIFKVAVTLWFVWHVILSAAVYMILGVACLLLILAPANPVTAFKEFQDVIGFPEIRDLKAALRNIGDW